MKATSADLLEFDDLKNLLGRFISSPLGLAELEKIAPSADQAALTEALDPDVTAFPVPPDEVAVAVANVSV